MATARLFSSAAAAPRTVGSLLASSTQRNALRDAWRLNDQQILWSFGEISKYSSAFAAGLAELGLRQGGKLALQTNPTTAESLIMQLAAARLGIETILIRPNADSATLANVLTSKQPTVVVFDANSTAASLFEGDLRPLREAQLLGAPFRSSKFPFVRHLVTTESSSPKHGVSNFAHIPVYGSEADRYVQAEEKRVTPSTPLLSSQKFSLTHQQALSVSEVIAKTVGLVDGGALVLPATSTSLDPSASPVFPLGMLAALPKASVLVIPSTQVNSTAAQEATTKYNAKQLTTEVLQASMSK
eukprot:TRINITY_DN282_c0_g1::TRINITY_DN282_c0_g1_i1::g.1586::m.1586 TRINITY_DN282_c0_g1::TRINITY_DN282_c0_g1_i1::g.1586  ORF type:complete len:312 (+),score=54.04,AMP-binding/PF00501.23/2.5e-08 TRINITY_DN282_c0_g1_i1:39-938(+)